jgi:hypothetical protein
MGGYISTFMRSTPAVNVNDVSGNTVQAPTETPSDTVATIPPTPDEQQTTVEAKKNFLSIVMILKLEKWKIFVHKQVKLENLNLCLIKNF